MTRIARAAQLSASIFQLGLESQTVIVLRMMKLAGGGSEAAAEAQRIEKIGTLDVSGSGDSTHLTLIWAEDGGPAVEGTPEMRGFGSKMISRSMAQQFDGALTYDWQQSGLVVTLRMRKDRLAA